MEIKKPTSQGIQLAEIGLANQEKASQIADRINNRNALQKTIGDVIAVARNNNSSGINELLESNQTLAEHMAKSSEMDQTKSKIEKEKQAAFTNFVFSSAGAAVGTAMGSAGGAAASTEESASSDNSKREPERMKTQSDIEIFQARIRKLLA
jgi:hypothetical protein